MEGIEIQEYRVGALKDVALFKTNGYIDTNTSPELQKHLGQTMEDGISQFVIDMGGVQYVSSAGWGVFVGEIRGLQEKGGDLKITQMSSEVYEVFEMLEFNRILKSYDTIEEAIEDFDFSRNLNALLASGVDVQESDSNVTITRPPERTEPSIDSAPAFAESMANEKPPIVHHKKRPQHTPQVDEPNLPLNEKIKKIVLENPILGVWGIKRMLYSPRFGYNKIGLYKLYKILKRMSLDTKAKRFRYFRSR